MSQVALPSLEADFELGFTYTRSLGPLIGKAFAAFAQRRIAGIKATDGRVIFPPVEFDPISCDPLNELVEIADTGTVITWVWNPNPSEKQPSSKPFAWAMILLDGADTPFLHRIASEKSALHNGMRVRASWKQVPEGDITDILHFEGIA